MTNNVLCKFITEISNRLPELSTTRLGKRFSALLRKKTKKPLEDCTLLLSELKVDEGSYQLAEHMMSPSRIAVLA